VQGCVALPVGVRHGVSLAMLNIFGRWWGAWRSQLPPRYSDGWQAGTVLDDTRAGPIEGFASLRRGVDVLVGQIVSTPLLVFNGTTEAPDSVAAKCLQRTNPADLETSAYDMLLTGNGWLHIVRTSDGVPYQLECVQAARMSAVLEKGRVVYKQDGLPIRLDDYVHLMCRNGFSPYLGDALCEAYSTSVAAILGTVSIFRQLQGNGSHAEVILSSDLVMTKDQMLQLRAAYIEQTSNQGKSGGVVILSSGLKPTTVRRLPSALDADIVKALDFSVAEASRMTGVPLSMLGVKDAVAYNSAIESSRAFFRVTLRPIFHRVESELSRKLGTSIRYDTGELVLGYGIERADVLSKLLYAGIITPNEARATLAYTSHAGADALSLPASQLPLDTWLEHGKDAVQTPAAKP
jgi:HK97 family phage portal protein